MYIESWTTTTFDGETFQQMTTSGSEGLDASIGLTTEARQPWFLSRTQLKNLNSCKQCHQKMMAPSPQTDSRAASYTLEAFKPWDIASHW